MVSGRRNVDPNPSSLGSRVGRGLPFRVLHLVPSGSPTMTPRRHTITSARVLQGFGKRGFILATVVPNIVLLHDSRDGRDVR